MHAAPPEFELDGGLGAPASAGLAASATRPGQIRALRPGTGSSVSKKAPHFGSRQGGQGRLFFPLRMPGPVAKPTTPAPSWTR